MRGAGTGAAATTSYCYLNCDPRPRMGDGLWIHYKKSSRKAEVAVQGVQVVALMFLVVCYGGHAAP